MDDLTIRRVAVVIDDDDDIRNLIETTLTQSGFEVITRSNGLDGVEAVREFDPVVTTLDVNMPGMDGMEAARRIRAISPTYIVMLTARDDEIDTLQGLDAGADDYMTKPFRPRELRARIEAMLRRARTFPPASPAVAPPSESRPDEDWLGHNGLRINPPMRIAYVDDEEVALTRTEFDLIAMLMESGRRVRTKADLALVLRAEDHGLHDFVSESDKRSIEVHLANLRKKIGDDSAHPRWIETVRGVGYRLTATEHRG